MPSPRIHLFVATAMEAAVARRVAGGHPVTVIGISGVSLPAAIDADVVVLVGFGGGLDPSLAIGDVIIDAPATVNIPAGARRGKIACADRIVATPAEKAAFRQRTGADVVEMEYEKVSRFTDRLGLPLVHIRAISDTADHTLDGDLFHIFDPQGNIKPGALAALVLRRPGLIPELIRLGRHTKAAGQQLAIVLKKLLENISQPLAA